MALGVATLAYVGLHDADIWTMVLLGLVVLGVGLYQTARRGGRGPGTMAEMFRDGWQRTRRWLLVGAVLVAASSLAGAGAYASHRNVVNIEEALYVRRLPLPGSGCLVLGARHARRATNRRPGPDDAECHRDQRTGGAAST